MHSTVHLIHQLANTVGIKPLLFSKFTETPNRTARLLRLLNTCARKLQRKTICTAINKKENRRLTRIVAYREQRRELMIRSSARPREHDHRHHSTQVVMVYPPGPNCGAILWKHTQNIRDEHSAGCNRVGVLAVTKLTKT